MALLQMQEDAGQSRWADMKDVIKQVAKAICCADQYDGRCVRPDDCWATRHRIQPIQARAAALATLRGIREPNRERMGNCDVRWLLEIDALIREVEDDGQ